MKKRSPFICLFLGFCCFSLFNPLFADDAVTALSEEIAEVESSSPFQSGSEMGEGRDFQTSFQRDPSREITPNAAPYVSNGADFFLTADFIYWKAIQKGIVYGFTGVPGSHVADSTLLQNLPSGKELIINGSWAPGFKVGLGMNFAHGGWDLASQYTWLYASKRGEGNVLGDEYPESLMSRFSAFLASSDTEGGATSSNFAVNFSGTKAHSRWSLHFNVIDLELGRKFYLSQFLTMRPFIGLKGTWQKQDWKRHFLSDNFLVPALSSSLQFDGVYKRHDQFDVWGIGLRGGLNLGWHFSRNWSVYGDLAWTAMWNNRYRVKRVERLIGDATVQGIQEEFEDQDYKFVNIDNDNEYGVNYIGEIEIGLCWETWLFDDAYHIAIQAGWEAQTWINWAHFIALQSYAEHDLNFQGLNLKLRFDF